MQDFRITVLLRKVRLSNHYIADLMTAAEIRRTKTDGPTDEKRVITKNPVGVNVGPKMFSSLEKK